MSILLMRVHAIVVVFPGEERAGSEKGGEEHYSDSAQQNDETGPDESFFHFPSLLFDAKCDCLHSNTKTKLCK